MIRSEVAAGRQADETGLDPETEAPFYDVLLAQALGASAGTGSDVEGGAGAEEPTLDVTDETDVAQRKSPDPSSAAKGREATNRSDSPGTALPQSGEALSERLIEVTVELVAHIRQEISAVDFWSNVHGQRVLRNWIVQFLDEADGIIPFDKLEHVADLLLELAKANHARLTR